MTDNPQDLDELVYLNGKDLLAFAAETSDLEFAKNVTLAGLWKAQRDIFTAVFGSNACHHVKWDYLLENGSIEIFRMSLYDKDGKTIIPSNSQSDELYLSFSDDAEFSGLLYAYGLTDWYLSAINLGNNKLISFE